MKLWRCLFVALAVHCVGGTASAATPFVRGDANQDGEIDVSDPVSTLLVLFAGREPAEPLDAFDVNDDGAMDVSDPIQMVQYLFVEGPPPRPPFPESGYDPTPTDPFREGDPPSLLADLAVEGFVLGPRNVLSIEVANTGQDVVAAGLGLLRVFVDGLPFSEHRFEEPITVGTQVIETGLRLGGSQRRVSAIIDPDNEVAESNEFQNSRHYTLSPTLTDGPDLVVVGLVPAADQLGVVIANTGNTATQDSLRVEFSVISEGAPLPDADVQLDALAPGQTVLAVPSPALNVSPGSRVRVALRVAEAGGDVDNTNNLYEAVFPDGPSFGPYEVLLGPARIGRSVVWRGREGTVTYPEWTAEQQAALRNQIEMLERTSPTDRSLPPPLVDERLGYISADDAWIVFLRHVAHCLWVEVNAKVAWRLDDLPTEQLGYLLDARTLLDYDASGDRYRFSSTQLGYVTAWNPRISYQFLRNLGCIRPTQRETIFALTDWMRGYLIHISGSDDVNELYGYPGWPPVDRILYSLETAHKSPGCAGATGFYGAMMRSVNVPAVRGTTYFFYRDCTNRGALHNRPQFPSVGLSMPHGDDPYNATLRPSGALVPSSELFYTMAEIDDLFLSPQLECSADGWCNGVGAQASAQTSRDHLKLADEYGTDYLLDTYARYGPEYLEGTLTGQRIGGGVVECANPLFPPEERAAMVQRVEGRLRELGDGDLEAGKELVRRRWSSWGRYIWP